MSKSSQPISRELLQDKLEFAEFEWNRATDGMKERDAMITALKARITELEANEAAYESILGPRTYNEIAEHIRGLEGALRLAEDVLSRRPFSTGIWPNGTHPQIGIEQIRAALSHAGPVARDGER